MVNCLSLTIPVFKKKNYGYDIFVTFRIVGNMNFTAQGYTLECDLLNMAK